LIDRKEGAEAESVFEVERRAFAEPDDPLPLPCVEGGRIHAEDREPRRDEFIRVLLGKPFHDRRRLPHAEHIAAGGKQHLRAGRRQFRDQEFDRVFLRFIERVDVVDDKKAGELLHELTEQDLLCVQWLRHVLGPSKNSQQAIDCRF
jgi:hypothetical protein